ncbi:MAG TPA: ThiF family adenylyltransferase [Ktedonobacterales bacterium]
MDLMPRRWWRSAQQAARAEGAEETHPTQDGQSTLELYARNWLFIPTELQARLRQTTLLTAGTGLGSVVATLAARVGFTRFVLVDGDVVERSNLNRQAFTQAHLGQNKAEATAEIIRAIVPEATVESVPRFVTADDVAAIVGQGDIIINTIDLDNLAFLKLNQAAREAKKPVLFPINLGWGGALLVFPPEGLSLDEYLALAPGQAGTEAVATQLIMRILQGIPGGIPPYLAALLPSFQSRDPASWPYDPQLGVATHLSAALSVRAAVALVAGEPLRVAPEVLWLDALSASTISTISTAPTMASPEHADQRARTADAAPTAAAEGAEATEAIIATEQGEER